MANHRRTLATVRYAGTALLCVVAAFGAAFLIRRAVDHGAPTPRGTVAADTRTSPSGPSPGATGHTADAVNHRVPPAAARRRVRPRRAADHAQAAQAQAQEEAPRGLAQLPNRRDEHPDVHDEHAHLHAHLDRVLADHRQRGSTGSSGAGTTHHSSGSGTGTTSIGGSGKGSGTTTIG